MTLRSSGRAALSLPIILSLVACSPFETRFKRVMPGVYHVDSVQCDASADASAALADIVAEAERRCRGGHRLDAGAHDVGEDVLRGQRPARGLAMRAQAERAWVLRVELLEQLGPQQPRRAHLGDFHEEVHADRPEEGKAGRKTIDVEAGGQARAQIFDAVG
mgnify:CR=1 FL=1